MPFIASILLMAMADVSVVVLAMTGGQENSLPGALQASRAKTITHSRARAGGSSIMESQPPDVVLERKREFTCFKPARLALLLMQCKWLFKPQNREIVRVETHLYFIATATLASTGQTTHPSPPQLERLLQSGGGSAGLALVSYSGVRALTLPTAPFKELLLRRPCLGLAQWNLLARNSVF